MTKRIRLKIRFLFFLISFWASETNTTEIHGSWLIKNSIDPITEKKVLIALNQAAEVIPAKSIGTVSLFLRCSRNDTDMFIDWDEYLGNSAYVTYKVDNDEPRRSRWRLSTDGSATFAILAEKKLLRMLEGEHLLVSVVPYRETKMVAKFDLEGINTVVNLIRKDCNW